MAMLTKHLMEDPVPPSVRRPDLAITPEMDALALKALEKDRDRRYQNMAEFLQAVSTCPGPDTASGELAAANYTREMGGAHAKAAIKAAIKDAKPAERASDTELVPRDWEGSADSEFRYRPARSKPNQKLILAVVGVILGAAGGVWLALHLRSAPAPTQVPAPVTAPAPTPVAAPAPAPTAVVPAPPVAPAPTATVAPELSKAGHASVAHKPKPGHAHPPTAAAKPGAASITPAAPTPPKPTPPRLPAPPSDLKPFPGM